MRSLVLLLVALGAGCGGNNDLGGSVGDSLDLGFSAVHILVDGGSLVVEYQAGSDTVCRLALNPGNLTIKSGSTLDSSTFVGHVTLSRATQKQDLFASVRSGQLHFDSYGLANGQRVAGSFTVLFDDGTTLHGAFSGKVAPS